MKVVLASGSPRRRELLAALLTHFEVQVSSVDEEAVALSARPDHPEEMVMLLAEAKARAVARSTEGHALVIGADTIVWHCGQALNKPVDADDAVAMAMSLAGRTHEVYTGVALIEAGDCTLRPAHTAFEATRVDFYPIDRDEARAYAATGEPMDKAGGYGIQDSNIGKRLVRAVHGDYYNVVGLPLGLLRSMLLPHFPELPQAPPQPDLKALLSG